jgi:hypothetical protein
MNEPLPPALDVKALLDALVGYAERVAAEAAKPSLYAPSEGIEWRGDWGHEDWLG